MKIHTTAVGIILSSTAFSAPKGEQLIGPTGITAVVGRNQIQVTAVDEGSPAAEKIKKGDVIVGAGDGKKKAGFPPIDSTTMIRSSSKTDFASPAAAARPSMEIPIVMLATSTPNQLASPLTHGSMNGDLHIPPKGSAGDPPACLWHRCGRDAPRSLPAFFPANENACSGVSVSADANAWPM